MENIRHFAIFALYGGLLLIGILALNAYRYEYLAQGESSNFAIRIDRFGGKPCYIPFTPYGAQLAAATLTLTQCE